METKFEIVDVDPVVAIPIHESMRAAIDASRERIAAGRRDSASIEGQRVRQYSFDGKALDLHLGGLVLRIIVANDGVI